MQLTLGGYHAGNSRVTAPALLLLLLLLLLP
jgi:hypothetical protein